MNTDNNSSGGGLMGKLGGLAGGGNSGNTGASEPMDPLDRGVAFAEGRVTGKPTDNSATGRAQTEKISDAVRSGYQKVTGDNVPIKDT